MSSAKKSAVAVSAGASLVVDNELKASVLFDSYVLICLALFRNGIRKSDMEEEPQLRKTIDKLKAFVEANENMPHVCIVKDSEGKRSMVVLEHKPASKNEIIYDQTGKLLGQRVPMNSISEIEKVSAEVAVQAVEE